MKAELQKNIVSQTVDIFLFDRKSYIIYDKEHRYNIKERDAEYSTIEPFISLPYEIYYDICGVIAEEYNTRKNINQTNGEHLKDLRWVLSHFINKDK